MRRTPTRRAAAAVLLVLGCALVTGCGTDHDASGGAPATTTTPSASSSAPDDQDGLEEMQKKVDAAESAASAADRDAAEDGDG